MRLIDADRLIMRLNDYALQESPGDNESTGERRLSMIAYNAIQNCMSTIEEQPTAFDPDCVLQQLKDRSVLSRPVGWTKAYEIVTLDDAVEIVKGGGVS